MHCLVVVFYHVQYRPQSVELTELHHAENCGFKQWLGLCNKLKYIEANPFFLA